MPIFRALTVKKFLFLKNKFVDLFCFCYNMGNKAIRIEGNATSKPLSKKTSKYIPKVA